MNQEIELAEQAMNNQDWPEAVKRWQKVFITLKEQTPAEAFVLLSMAHRFQGNVNTAEKNEAESTSGEISLDEAIAPMD